MDTYNPTLFLPLEVDNDFIKNYRASLEDSYNAGVAALENQRKLDHGAIMNAANRAGVMFSNIPAAQKTRYDTTTYMPGLVNLRNTYQTGLDTLRSNAINAANQVAYYQQMINHYNTMPTGSTTGNSTDLISNALKEALGVNLNGTGSSSSTPGVTNKALNAGLSMIPVK